MLGDLDTSGHGRLGRQCREGVRDLQVHLAQLLFRDQVADQVDPCHVRDHDLPFLDLDETNPRGREERLRELRVVQPSDARENDLADVPSKKADVTHDALRHRREVVEDRLQSMRFPRVGERVGDSHPIDVAATEERILPDDVPRHRRVQGQNDE